MTLILLKNLTIILFLIMTGFAIMQLILKENRISLLQYLPFSFPVGVIFVYIISYLPVHLNLMPESWHWFSLSLGLLVIIFGCYYYLKQPKLALSWDLKFYFYDYFLVALILVKVFILIYINMVNPVVDSDATNPYRHVGLAKLFFWGYPIEETTAYTSGRAVKISPSIMHTFINSFQLRWHDSVATIHYQFFYIFSLLMVIYAGLKLKIKPTFVLLAAYIFTTQPLVAIHVIRPGYADLLVMSYFMVALVALMSYFLSKQQSPDRLTWLLLFIAIFGMMSNKLEGIIASAWTISLFTFLFLVRRWHFNWLKLLAISTAIIFILYLVYFFIGDWLIQNFDLSVGTQVMLQKRYDPKAINAFFQQMFIGGGQGLVWWLFILCSILALFKTRKLEHRLLIGFAIVLVIAVFYFSCFTDNVQWTLNYTNVGRFLLQLSPLFIVSYYLAILNFSNMVQSLESSSKQN